MGKSIKQGLASLVLAGSALAGSGCDSIYMTPAGEALGRSMVLGGAAIYADTPQEAAAWELMSDIARTQAQIEGAKEAAREGRTQVNVYNQQPNITERRVTMLSPVSTDNVSYLDENTFYEFIFEEDAAVNFYAGWSLPCKKLAPYFEDAAKSIDYVKFGKIDHFYSRDVFSDFGVRAMPTIILFKNGEEITRLRGSPDIKSEIEEIYQTNPDKK